MRRIMRRNDAGETASSTPAARADRIFGGARSASKKLAAEIGRRRPNPEWQTIEYDADGHPMAMHPGYTDVNETDDHRRRRKNWEASSAYLRQQQLEASEHPMWIKRPKR